MAMRIPSALTKCKTSSFTRASEGGTGGLAPGFWNLIFLLLHF